MLLETTLFMDTYLEEKVAAYVGLEIVWFKSFTFSKKSVTEIAISSVY